MARFLSGFEEIIVPTYHRFVPPVPYSTSMRFPTYSSSNSSFVVIGEEGGPASTFSSSASSWSSYSSSSAVVRDLSSSLAAL